MKFEIIDNRELDLAGKGYKRANELSQVDQAVLDDIRRIRGENYVDGLSDDLFDGYLPICRERENVENGVKACTFRAVLEKYSTKWVAASLTKYVIAKFEGVV